MPVPRLFDGPVEQKDRWVHVLACLVGLTGPKTRPALLQELTGELDLVRSDTALTREFHPVGDSKVDILARDRDGEWAVAVQSTLAFGVDISGEVLAALEKLEGQTNRVISVVITADRREPAFIEAIRAKGHTVVHKSWLRVRDWVQERPERGAAEGVDLVLLRDAEYFLTPRVAELYRLEDLAATIDASIRPALSDIYFDFNDISPAPLMTNPPSGIEETTITFPRTGDAGAEIRVHNGALSVNLKEAGVPGFEADGDGSTMSVKSSADWSKARSSAVTAAHKVLPARR